MRGGALTLPGWRSSLWISPLSRPLDIQGSHSAHGALSLILGRPHDRKAPNFAMIADREWQIREVHWLHPDAFRLSDTRHTVEMYQALRGVQIGPMREVLVDVAQPGRYTVDVRAITPLILRQTEGRRELRWLDPARLVGGVQQNLRKVLGRAAARPFEGAPLRWTIADWKHVPFRDPWEEQIGGGVMFSAIVETDAAGLTALRVLAELGMGSRTSRGYGRIRLARVMIQLDAHSVNAGVSTL